MDNVITIATPDGRRIDTDLRTIKNVARIAHDPRQIEAFTPKETGAADAAGIAAGQLKAFVERIERLEEEKQTFADDIKDVYAEAKGAGFDVKILRQVIRIRKQDKSEREEMEAIATAVNFAGASDEAVVAELIMRLQGGSSVDVTDLAMMLEREADRQVDGDVGDDIQSVADRIRWRQPREAVTLLERYFPALDGLARAIEEGWR